MRLRTHILTSTLLGVALYPRDPRRAALLALSGVLVDLDHFVLYAIRSGDWNPLGALRYDRWRHIPRDRRDTRRRYGPLRSIVHRPWFTLPLVWALAARWSALRPVAIGVTLHLALDFPFTQIDRRVWRRAGDCCERCGARDRERQVIYLQSPRYGGARWALGNRAAWCKPCIRAVYG